MMATVSIKRSWSSDLDPATLYALLKLRVDVFVVEQNAPYAELDGLDLLPETRHFWLEDADHAVVGTLRLLEEHDDGVTSFRIGRVCLTPAARGHGLTTRLMRAALADVHGLPCRLSAQSHLIDLYAKYGFSVDGAEYDDAGVPHVPMRRR